MTMSFLRNMGAAACVAAGVVGGMMVNLLSARRRYAMAGEFGGGRENLAVETVHQRLPAEDPFRELRAALVGRHRKQIVRALGAPTTASIEFASAAIVGASLGDSRPLTYWQATTWYYPFDHKQRKAIAIRFVRDRAREVEFIGAPG